MTTPAAPILLLCTLAAAAPAQDFLSVPYIASSNAGLFTQLFSRARAGPGLHALVIGDSQETSPLSFGTDYIPQFNAEWAQRYGVSPRTPLVQPGLTFAAPTGEWLTSARHLSPSAAPPSTPFASNALPGLADWEVPFPLAGERGWALLLQPRATGVNSQLPIDHSRFWLDMSQGIFLDVYALRAGGEAQITVTLVASDTPGGGGLPIFTGSTDLAGTPETGPVARQRIGPITWTAPPYMSIQAELVGATPGTPLHLISASFASVASDRGLAATDIAAGGYTVPSLVTNHAAALPHLAALNVDLVFITLGANDISFPPAQFKQNLTDLIATLRQYTKPDLPVVIMCDPAQGLTDPLAQANYDAFPRAAAELAAALPDACALNSRRLTHERGWTPDNLAPFTVTDRVHYTTAGAVLKARLEVDTLWRAFVCPPDIGRQGGLPGGDGRLDNNDFIAFIAAFFALDPAADLGHQGGLAGGDGQFDNNDFIAFIAAFFAGCP